MGREAGERDANADGGGRAAGDGDGVGGGGGGGNGGGEDEGDEGGGAGREGETSAVSGRDGVKNKETLDADRDFCRVVTRYDPEAVRREALVRPLELARRSARLAVVLGRMRNKRARLQALDAADGGSRWGEAVKETLCELGPLFVKLGQNLANRPDLVNEELMEELTKLQDRVPPFNSSLAYKIIEEETGRVIEETFSEISEEPIASASIGQVYKGKLRKDGTDVAIKVLRPNTRAQCVLDLFLLRATALMFFDTFARENLGCSASLLVDEFAEKLLEELDFVQEARNLRDFAFNFATTPTCIFLRSSVS